MKRRGVSRHLVKKGRRIERLAQPRHIGIYIGILDRLVNACDPQARPQRAERCELPIGAVQRDDDEARILGDELPQLIHARHLAALLILHEILEMEGLGEDAPEILPHLHMDRLAFGLAHFRGRRRRSARGPAAGGD